MALVPIFSFFFLILVGPISASSRHVIPITKPDLHPSSLAWDPSAQHFLIGSRHRPLVSFVSDAGVVQPIIANSDLDASSVTALAVDDTRRRLIAAFSSPATIAAYDLRSIVPHRQIFSSPLPDPSASVTGASVNPTTGSALIATSSGEIFALDLSGKVSTLAHVSGKIGGLDHVSGRGFLLVVDKSDKGGILKVDADDGLTKMVLMSAAAGEAAENVAVRSDGAAIVAGGAAARWVKSGDGWAEAAVHDEFRVGEGERVEGVAIRGGKMTYVLVVKEEDEEGQNGKGTTMRIEEVEWGKEGEGDLVWVLVLVGLGLAYFTYWRLQMGKLVTSLNKKRS